MNIKEFRLVWRKLDGSKMTELLKVKCPNALKYCKFIFDEVTI